MINAYQQTRQRTLSICQPLVTEDYVPQPMENVSPPKWHLAHTTWFFEQFILVPYLENYTVFDQQFAYLFNSYYNNMGQRVARNERGFLSRPTVKKIEAYRQYVDEAMARILNLNLPDINRLTILGINHEQQHQELLIYDIKYILGTQPAQPIYGKAFMLQGVSATSAWLHFKSDNYRIGTPTDSKEFAFDNESPQHEVHLQEFQIATQLVTNNAYIEFMNDGGYDNFNLWHDEGWQFIRENNIAAPLYWKRMNGNWVHYTMNGIKAIQPDAPVQHLSLYEAAAFAAWSGLRLPTELEWEVASSHFDWGSLWEWTNSAYLPYPGYQQAPGAIGEYNGKFMINQHVLRGASIATSPNHSRTTYRNFFHPSTRWVFNGIRLAK